MRLTKKNIFVLLSVCILALVVLFSFQHVFNVIPFRDLATDSGFDSDFGGSDSGFDSDFGGSSGGGSSGGSNGSFGSFGGFDDGTNKVFDSIISFIILSFVTSTFVIFPVKIYLSNKKNGKVNYRDEFSLSMVYGFYLFFALNIMLFISNFLFIALRDLIPTIINNPIEFLQGLTVFIFPILIIWILGNKMDNYKLAKKDAKYFKEALDNPSMVKEAYDIYVRIQEAWSKNDIEDVRDVLSSEMYNMYSSQIQTMIRKKQRNAMSDFKFVKGVIHGYQKVDGQDRYVVTLRVLCKDYLINDETNRLISGSRKRINDYTYSLTFIKRNSVDVDKCPNCDAKLPSTGQNVKCEYCGSVIERKAANLVLIDKKMLIQR